VPLIIAGTGIEAGAIDRELIRIEDLMPTLLRIAKIDRQDWPSMDGVDMSARLRGSLFSRRSSDRAESIVTLAESGSALQARFFNRVVSGARGGLACTNGPRYSLCRQPDGPAELYDHIADPLLTTDLSAKHPDRVALLEETAALWPVERARQRAIRTTRFKLVARPRPEGGYVLSLYDLERDPRETRDARSEHPEIFRQLKERLDTWSASLPDLDVPQRSATEMEALRALGYVEGPE
jgi:arylsulfatase A-like enzyme